MKVGRHRAQYHRSIMRELANQMTRPMWAVVLVCLVLIQHEIAAVITGVG